MTRGTDELQFEKVNILGVGIHIIPIEELISYICDSASAHKKVLVTYANVHTINLAYQVSWFRDFLNSCNLVFCDGFGVKWAAKLLYKTTIYRHTPPDWFALLAKEFGRKNLTMYFLGAKPGVAEKAANILIAQSPGLRIVGCHHGYFDKSSNSLEQRAIIEEINNLCPNLLILGFGMPTQEAWIQEHWDQISADVALPTGAMLDYLAGEVYRAPRCMTDHGFEWLGRLIIEPQRLWRRYLIGNPLFMWRVFKQKRGN